MPGIDPDDARFVEDASWIVVGRAVTPVELRDGRRQLDAGTRRTRLMQLLSSPATPAPPAVSPALRGVQPGQVGLPGVADQSSQSGPVGRQADDAPQALRAHPARVRMLAAGRASR